MSDATCMGTPVEPGSATLKQVALGLPGGIEGGPTRPFWNFPGLVRSTMLFHVSTPHKLCTFDPCHALKPSTVSLTIKPQVLALAYLSSPISLHPCPHFSLSGPSCGVSVRPA